MGRIQALPAGKEGFVPCKNVLWGLLAFLSIDSLVLAADRICSERVVWKGEPANAGEQRWGGFCPKTTSGN